MYPRISTTHSRPSGSNSMATGCCTSGSAATTSARNPGGRLNVLAASSALSSGTGLDSGCVEVVATALVDAVFVVAGARVAPVARVVAGPRSLDASVAIAAGFGTPLLSACGFADPAD